ncbi:MAG: hypothetical protein ABRQ25_16190 [Clostridiaceae bacterium]
MNKKKIIIGSFTVAVILLGIIINTVFLFNPFTFKKEKAVYLPFTWYRKPITFLVSVNGTTKELYMMDENAKFIYKELNKTEVLGSLFDSKLRLQYNIEEKGQLNIQSYKNGIVTKIRWYGENSDVCSTTGDFGYEAIVKMTPELKEYLNNLFVNQENN